MTITIPPSTLPPFSSQLPRHIDDLPVEVLTEVFTLYDDDFHIMESHVARRGPPRPVITVSHVSRRWRSVAISCQWLWSTALPCGSLEWTRVCLSRCPTSSFELAISGLDLGQKPEYRAAYELVRPHLPRARAVAFELDTEGFDLDSERDLPSNTLRELFDELSTTTMPFTTTLEVYHILGNGALKNIPKVALAETMPVLTDLWLSGIVYRPPDCRSIFPPSLRSLYLGDSHCWRTVDEMIDTLRTIPMLEELTYTIREPTVYYPKGTPRLSRIHPPRCVELKRLRSFHCEVGSFMRSMLLFRYLSFPSNATLWLQFSRRIYGEILHVRFHPFLIRDLLASSKEVFHAHFAPAIKLGAFYPSLCLDKYAIVVNYNSNCTSHSGPLLPDGSSAGHLLPRNIHLGILRDGPEGAPPQPIHGPSQGDLLSYALSPLSNRMRMLDTWGSLPFLAHARTLHFLPDPAYDAFHPSFLAHFTRVTEIHLSSWPMFVDSFCKLLLQPEVVSASSYWESAMRSDLDSSAKVQLFPKLQTIHVQCRPATVQKEGSRAHGSVDEKLPLLIHLADELVSHWGQTLKHIVLHNSRALSNEATAVSSLNDILGAECVVCDDRMLGCCKYLKRRYTGGDGDEDAEADDSEEDERSESSRGSDYESSFSYEAQGDDSGDD